jgi:hypothetical protein
MSLRCSQTFPGKKKCLLGQLSPFGTSFCPSISGHIHINLQVNFPLGHPGMANPIKVILVSASGGPHYNLQMGLPATGSHPSKTGPCSVLTALGL